MTQILRNADGTINGFYERVDDLVLDDGQSLEEDERSFVEYAGRLVLSADGRSGETVVVEQDIGDLVLEIDCVERGGGSVEIAVNDLIEAVAIDADGCGSITLSTAVAGRFVLGPAERDVFCWGGEAVLVVEVEEA